MAKDEGSRLRGRSIAVSILYIHVVSLEELTFICYMLLDVHKIEKVFKAGCLFQLQYNVLEVSLYRMSPS